MKMLTISTLFLTVFNSSGCMTAPVERGLRWAEVVLEAAPPGEAPDYVPILILDAQTRRAITDNEARTLLQGARIRQEGETLRTPLPDSNAYAARQRDRARPPERPPNEGKPDV